MDIKCSEISFQFRIKSEIIENLDAYLEFMGAHHLKGMIFGGSIERSNFFDDLEHEIHCVSSSVFLDNMGFLRVEFELRNCDDKIICYFGKAEKLKTIFDLFKVKTNEPALEVKS